MQFLFLGTIFDLPQGISPPLFFQCLSGSVKQDKAVNFERNILAFR